MGCSFSTLSGHFPICVEVVGKQVERTAANSCLHLGQDFSSRSGKLCCADTVLVPSVIFYIFQSCQSDLVKDGGYKYFIQILSDQSLQYEYRTMAAFVLSKIVDDHRKGQASGLCFCHHTRCIILVTTGGVSTEQCHFLVSVTT